jgi:hypothetical protein
MADRLFTHTLWTTEAIADAGTLTSPAIDLKLCTPVALVLLVTSVLGNASVRAEFQTSQDATNWDAIADNPDIVTATLAAKANNPEGWNTFPVPDPLNRHYRIIITDLASTTDSLVSAVLLCRETGRL